MLRHPVSPKGVLQGSYLLSLQKSPKEVSLAIKKRTKGSIKKMITEVLLTLPLYLILFFIWWQFRHLIKIMADAGDILNDELFDDVVDTPREGIEQHKKREELKNAVDKGKLHKWTHRGVDKASDKIINKTYTEYRQREFNQKGEKTRKALGKHVINLYSTGISRVTNYSKTLGMIQSLKKKWLTWVVC